MKKTQIKVKCFTSLTLIELENKINYFICEEIEECEVKDIKFTSTVATFEDTTSDYYYSAMILYI